MLRQAALLADLLSESLGDILRLATEVRDEEEWQAQFQKRYRGQAVIFDDVVRRDSAGSCSLAVLEIRDPRGESAHIVLDDLNLIRGLPLDQPQRLLFGARLAAVVREPPGIWTIRFVPDSGVLLTSEVIAGTCCPQPLDAELRDLLHQQAQWVRLLP